VTQDPAGRDPRLIWDQAAKGDAAAQLFLARAHDAAGKSQEGRSWLSKAIASDYPPAFAYRGECALLTAAYRDAARDFRTASEHGDPAGMRLRAQLSMAGLMDGDCGWNDATSWLRRAAAAQDKVAQRDLAMLLEMNGGPGGNLLLSHAAQAGDAIAVALVLRRAARDQLDMSEDRLTAYRAALARQKYPMFEDAVAQAHPFPPPGQLLEPNWSAIGDALTEPPRPVLPKPERLCEKPRVSLIHELLTSDECAYVIGLAAPMLEPSRIVDPLTGQGRQDPVRTNLAMAFSSGRMSCVMTQLAIRLSQCAQTPLENAEPPGVLSYRPGQEYRPHFDWLAAGPGLDRGGQRTRTALVYLNQGYGGGQTHFLDPGLDVPAGEGDCVVFDNVEADGAPDMNSRHAGRPVTSGVKYLWSQWYRERPVPRTFAN
jgi:prolyl 4-hydroxylase